MAVPTNTANPGTISATTEAEGILVSVNKSIPDAVLTVRLSGTYTTGVVVVRARLAGTYGDASEGVYGAIAGVDAKTTLPVGTAGSITLTNSTTYTFNFPVGPYDYVEIYASSLASGAIVVGTAQAPPSTVSPPVVNATVSGTSGTTATFSTSLSLPDNATLLFGTSDDISITWNGTDLAVTQLTADSQILWGVSGAGINHVFYGDTAGRNMTWDQSNDQLLFADNAKLAIGSGAGAAGDITFLWNATKMLVAQLTANSAIDWGVDGAGIDQVWYGDTASANATWDQSADSLIFGGVAGIQNLKVKQSTPVAITGATALVLADSGGIWTVSQAAAYDIDLPSPTTGAGASYFFSLTGAAANNVTITVAGSAATFVGSIQIDGATVVATGSTLTFASGAASLGDSIQVRSIATNLYHVIGMAAATGGITIS